MKVIYFRDWGVLPYGEALERQLEYFNRTKKIKVANRGAEKPEPTQSYFFFVTHPHVFTMGKNGDVKNLLWDEKVRQIKQVEYFPVNRGGDATYHGPGQIVGYPILDLDHFTGDIHLYMRKLEEVIIHTLSDYGIRGERSEGETGVWLDTGTPRARKICAMGVHTSRWVTMHGFALNANTDISYFNGIVPCGITNKGVTSMHLELKEKVDENKLKERILFHFEDEFQAEFISF